jgi:hypothetical protein
MAHDGTLSFKNFMLMVEFLRISILSLYALLAYGHDHIDDKKSDALVGRV